MDAFSDSLLDKRTALLNSLKEPRKECSLKSRSKTLVKEQGTALECDSLKSGVYHSIHMLLCRGYDFHKILIESGVNRAFLEQAFCELRIPIMQGEVQQPISVCQRHGDVDLNKYHSQLDKVSIRQDSNGSLDDSKTNQVGHRDSIGEINRKDRIHQRSPNESVSFDIRYENKGLKSKNIEVEMRLFMLRIQLEINKFSTLVDNTEFAEQIENQMVQKNILSKRDLMMSNLNQVFDKIYEKGKVIEFEQSGNTNDKNDAIYPKRKRIESAENNNVDSQSLQLLLRTKEQSNMRSGNKKASQSVSKGNDVEGGDSTGSRFREISKVCL